MTRIRTVKPSFWEDETVGALSRDARLLFIATWNLADDTGVLRWSVAYIRASVFMYDDVSAEQVREWMIELATHGFVVCYSAGSNATPWASIRGFTRHQRINRPSPSRLPQPPDLQERGDGKGFTEQHRNGSVNDSLNGSVREVEVEVEVEVTTLPTAAAARVAEEFDRWWQVVPRKVGKGQARRAFKGALAKTDLETLIATTASGVGWNLDREAQFRPYPSTWLAGEHWADEAPGAAVKALSGQERERRLREGAL